MRLSFKLPSRACGVDLAAILVLAVALVAAALPVYGPGWIWVCVLGGTLLGVALALVSQHLAWNPALTAGAWLLGWFVFGGVLAMPGSTIAGFIPTGRTMLGLLSGPVRAWRDMLTIAPPLGTTDNLMTVALLLASTSALAATTLARRSKHPSAAWLPQVLAIMVLFALGVNYSYRAALVSAGVVFVILVWTSYQRHRLGSSLVQSAGRNSLITLFTAAAVIALATVLMVIAAPVVMPHQERNVIRSHVSQPLDVRAYPSPLQAFRGNIANANDTVLLHVDGAENDMVLRIATLDAYDGLTYNVSNSLTGDKADDFRRVGARIDDPVSGVEKQLQVKLLALPAGVWLPNVGYTKDVEFHGPRAVALSETFFHNIGSQTSIVTAGLQPGDSYTLTSVWRQRPAENLIKSANAVPYPMPPIGDVPDVLRDLAVQWTAGAQSDGQAALLLENRFSTGGWFSHGVDPQDARSLSGHSYSRMLELLADQERMVGDDEQYAVAMALMLRVRNVAARVVYGYQIPADGDVKGSDVRAFTEVNLDGLGWVLFNPTPSHDRKLPDQDPNQQPQTRPHVENPPPPPQRPDEPPPDDQLPVDQANPPQPPPRIDIQQVLRVTASFGLPLIVLVGPLVLVLGLKHRRRRARMGAAVVANRVAGGWSELLDVARDLGTSPSPMATRSEQAEVLASKFTKLEAHVDSNRLARQADAAIFAPEAVSAEQAKGYWNAIDEGVAGLRDSVGLRRALVGRLSMRSFRGFRLRGGAS